MNLGLFRSDWTARSPLNQREKTAPAWNQRPGLCEAKWKFWYHRKGSNISAMSKNLINFAFVIQKICEIQRNLITSKSLQSCPSRSSSPATISCTGCCRRGSRRRCRRSSQGSKFNSDIQLMPKMTPLSFQNWKKTNTLLVIAQKF